MEKSPRVVHYFFKGWIDRYINSSAIFKQILQQIIKNKHPIPTDIQFSRFTIRKKLFKAGGHYGERKK